MTRSRTIGIWILGVILTAGASVACAATVTTLSVDFESPIYQPGLIGGNCCVAGQGGWAGSFASVTTAQAHGGLQSLSTIDSNAFKALDASQGEFPSIPIEFEIPYASDWWAQAYVYVNSGGSGATMTLFNSLGGCPLIQISGNGTPLFHSCTRQDTSQGSLAAGILDQWVLLRMVHTAAMGQGLDMSIIGPNIDLTINLDQYGGPGSGNPRNVDIRGNAYWDDISAGYGPAPEVVPVPAAGFLMATSLSAALLRLRRRTGRSGAIK